MSSVVANATFDILSTGIYRLDAKVTLLANTLAFYSEVSSIYNGPQTVALINVSGNLNPAPTPPNPVPTGSPLPPTDGRIPLNQMSLGINLNGVTYYSPEWVYTDLWKTASWPEDNALGWFISNQVLPLPPLINGYPAYVEGGMSLSNLAGNSKIGGRYPAGMYTVMFDGSGTIRLKGDGAGANIPNNGLARYSGLHNITATDYGVEVGIYSSARNNPVRNIRLIMPGFNGNEPFHPLFVSRLAPFKFLRFMDWGVTNNSTLSAWANRRLPSERTQHTSGGGAGALARGGIAYEEMIRLANLTGKHPWFCIPHMANDDFVTQLATLIKNTLRSDLTVFIELSNEVWNPQFAQNKYFADKGVAAGTTYHIEYAKRAAQVYALARAILGPSMYSVFGAQLSPFHTNLMLNALPSGAADCVAIGSYFGGALGDASNWQATATMTVDQVLDAADADITALKGRILSVKALTDAKGIPLISYEGGQHLVGTTTAAQNSSALNALFYAANRHLRMEILYARWLQMWKDTSQAPLAVFSSVRNYTKTGSWGILEYQDQAQSTAPKYKAIMDWQG